MMYAYIKGKLVHSGASSVILEANGIGYLIYVPVSCLSGLPQQGEALLLHTSLIIREDSQTLYGFLDVSQKELFEVLLGVSGIGPKTALSLLGHLGIGQLQEAISHNELNVLTKVPGIGKRTAERLVVELRDKLQGMFPRDSAQAGADFTRDPRSQMIQDAMSALIHLGYNHATAQKAVKKTVTSVSGDVDLSLLIKIALTHI